MPLPQFSGVLGEKRASHLLRRASFGPTKQQIDSFSAMTVSEAVSRLFPGTLPDASPPVDPATGEEWVSGPVTDTNSSEDTLQEYFKGWLIGQMVSVGVPENQKLAYSVREKITFFMHTHFTTMQSKVNNSKHLYFQNVLFRRFALDGEGTPNINFRTLTKKICVDNAMLIFLDGKLNVKGSPNENFARELFELYVIGKGLAGTIPPDLEAGDYLYYSEQDIQAAARVLSGWEVTGAFDQIDPDTGIPRGKVRGGTTASAHDNDPKQFSGRMAHTLIQPDPLLVSEEGEATRESALDEISQLIDMLYAQEETARYICRKLYRFFVYYHIPQSLEDTVISELADTFRANNFKIQPVLEEIFRSQHFYEGAGGVVDDSFGGIIKSPLDLAVGTLRFFEVPLPDPAANLPGFYKATGDLIKMMRSQGEDFYEPVEVAGYPAYHQFPAFNRNWISTNYLTRRYDFIRKTLSSMNMDPDALHVDILAFINNNFPDAIASNARQLIITLVKYLFPLSGNLTFDPDAEGNAGLTAERLHYFLQAFLFNPKLDIDPEAAWTLRYTHDYDREVRQRQLESLLNAMLQSPEYQLM